MARRSGRGGANYLKSKGGLSGKVMGAGPSKAIPKFSGPKNKAVKRGAPPVSPKLVGGGGSFVGKAIGQHPAMFYGGARVYPTPSGGGGKALGPFPRRGG